MANNITGEGLLHILLHLLLSSVHKYTNIYDGIVLFALKRVVVVDRGSIPYPFLWIVFTNTGIDDGTVLLALKRVVVFERGSIFHLHIHPISFWTVLTNPQDFMKV